MDTMLFASYDVSHSLSSIAKIRKNRKILIKIKMVFSEVGYLKWAVDKCFVQVDDNTFFVYILWNWNIFIRIFSYILFINCITSKVEDTWPGLLK